MVFLWFFSLLVARSFQGNQFLLWSGFCQGLIGLLGTGSTKARGLPLNGGGRLSGCGGGNQLKLRITPSFTCVSVLESQGKKFILHADIKTSGSAESEEAHGWGTLLWSISSQRFLDTCYDAGDPRKNFGMLEHELRIEVIVCHILWVKEASFYLFVKYLSRRVL